MSLHLSNQICETLESWLYSTVKNKMNKNFILIFILNCVFIMLINFKIKETNTIFHMTDTSSHNYIEKSTTDIHDEITENKYSEIMARFIHRQIQLRNKCQINNVPSFKTGMQHQILQTFYLLWLFNEAEIFAYVPQYNMSTCFIPKAGSTTWAYHIIIATNASTEINRNIHVSAKSKTT